MVIHLTQGRDTTIDYRETAPAAITRESFLDANGEADAAKSRDSALAIGVPGTVAGLALAHASYGSGRFTLAELLGREFGPVHCRAPRDDGDTVAARDVRPLPERQQPVGRRQGIAVVALAVEMLVLEEQHRVFAAERGAQQTGRVAGA